MKKIITICIAFLLATPSLHSISRNTAYGITAGAGVGTFLISCAITKQTLFSLICATPVSIFTYFTTMRMTPEGRFKSALQKVKHLTLCKFAEYGYDDINVFIEELQNEFPDHFWLITAHDKIDALLKEGYHALELLMLVKQEAHDNYPLIEKTHDLDQKARMIMAHLTTALRRIKNHADFSSQRTAYHQLLIEKERLALEREKTYAKQSQAAAQVAQAHAQQSQANALWYRASK